MFSGRPNRRRFVNTIGARLTLWGGAVMFAVCATLCAILYAGFFFSLRGEIDSFLKGEVYEFLATVDEYKGDNRALEVDVQRELSARGLGDLAFRMFDAQGRLMVSSEPDDAIAAEWWPNPTQAGRYVEPTFETVSPAGADPPYRLCTLRTVLPSGVVRLVQASYSLERMVSSLAHFRRTCSVTLVASLLLALVAGRFLAIRSLQPIKAITGHARQIGADRLDERIPSSGSNDELDQLVATLNAMLARIERYVGQLKQFVADASHELRTPLAALRGATEVALSRPRSADHLRGILEDNVAQYERLQRIAEDLLLLAQLDAGEDVLRRGTVHLDKTVSNVVDLYRSLAEDNGIELDVEMGGPIAITGDSGRIQQVLGNLIDNAVKHTPPRGRIRVSVLGDETQARIIVADTGVGIAGESLPRVFDRFFRVDRARSPNSGGGAGLGLSICRSIVEAHGGSIGIESTPDLGTTATVTFSLQVED